MVSISHCLWGRWQEQGGDDAGQDGVWRQTGCGAVSPGARARSRRSGDKEGDEKLLLPLLPGLC